MARNYAVAPSSLRELGVTTYLREGPGVQFRVIDEATNGITVTLDSCARGWCRISYDGASGFVAQSALVPAGETTPAPQHPVCFTNREAGYRSGRDVVLCAAGTAPTIAPAAPKQPSR